MIGSLKNPSIATKLYASGLYASDENKESNKQRSHFLKNLFENPNVSVLKLNSLYNSSITRPYVTQLKFLIDAMKTTQQSCLESERVS